VIAELIHRLRGSGLHGIRSQRSLWIHGGSVADFAAARELLKDLRRALPASYLLFTTADPSAAAWLRLRYPGHPVLPPPWNVAPSARWFFAQLDPVLLVWLGFDESLPLGALRGARRRGLPIFVADGRRPTSPSFALAAAALVDRFCVREPEVAAMLRSCGADADAIAVTGELAGEERGADGELPTLRCMRPLLDRVPRTVPADFHGRRRMRQLAKTGLGRWIAATRSQRRIPDWEALRRRLGSPDTILCLGNGPSSEDPAVRAVPHDCLFRVNHRWLARGVLTQPDMVFVGNLRTTLAVRGCVFGFRVVAKEREILLRHLLFGLRPDRIEHFTVERVPSLLDDRAWPANPTNGAIMVATAVMLRPKCLVIAGIDLFDDPRGGYPDDALSENDYLPGHGRGADLDVIEHALSRFEGDVVLLSPALERALRELRSASAREPGAGSAR
jgi:hypothetical protein